MVKRGPASRVPDRRSYLKRCWPAREAGQRQLRNGAKDAGERHRLCRPAGAAGFFN
jgi:hypothetical protein